ncbi:UDP-glucose dehydrogenase [Talaromyces stipitatus ATCC 10500]|uniref:UDP-glucose 6-dehydrogenase n=1 Tax=Talaromyces stipitatus (strain ATCC 10500 / CBS 375.48 / QM 6759 / NRRL 1006) TaxID=441959 RepID=B8MBQ5_TALSN|nr:UDP-glucose dehydrogenase [Talaromyces stipitatus ATCC 10500]EED18188.1 UDP-glucose dehydrogenase [Talaromyces stipitatus ATCC 10500]
MDSYDFANSMDFLSTSPSTTADDSSCDDSTGPTTPESISPLLGAARVEDVLETPLAQYLNKMKPPVNALAKKLPFHAAPNQRDALFSKLVRHIAVVGAGYVGGPTAAVIALHNPHIRVDVLDKDPRRVRRWNSPHLPIYEPGLVDIVRVSRDGASARLRDASVADTPVDRIPNLFFTTDSQTSLAKADVVMLAVNTPTKTFGVGGGRATNMTTFDAAAKEVALYARPGTIIVEKSTVPCGTAQRVRKMLDEVRPGVPFEIVSNPEFLSEGTAVRNLMQPDRVLIGSDKTPSGRRAAEALANVYAAWVPRPRILEVNAWSSELAKLVSNAMLAQRISSINSISAICDKTGADIDEIAKSAGIDPRIGSQFLKAGLGFGGSCFRKDISSLTYLAESLGLPEVAHYWSQVNSMNEWQRDRFAYKIIRRLEENLVGKKVALLGFAFKKNTGDTRESLAVDVIRVLLQERPGEIAIFDPCCLSEDIIRELEPILDSATRERVHVYSDAYQACQQAHAVVVINDSDPFRQSPAKQRNSNVDGGTRTYYEPSPHVHAVSEDIVIEGSRFSYLPGQSPICAEDCPDCQSTKLRGAMSSEPVEWARIAYGMKDPKWIFDGRGVLDVPEMEKLGYRVETLGRQTKSR